MSDINTRTFLQFSKYVSLIVALFYIYLPLRHAKYYSYVKIDEILSELEILQITKATNLTDIEKCPYEDVIKSNREIPIRNLFKAHEFEFPKLGGEYTPQDCLPYNRSAILVPYRNRKQHLNTFLQYMHSFLQKQYISYRIFIIEQNNELPFNRAKLLNIGAVVAIRMNYHCLILSDVDLLPLNTGNLYACSKLPRHMCSSLDTFRYNLPYEGLFGGVISITSDQFKEVNGMSNEYFGWGGEDDDFYRRLTLNNITPYRFSPKISKYTMLKHPKETPSLDRFEKLEHSSERQKFDGLGSLSDHYAIMLKPLYTSILVN